MKTKQHNLVRQCSSIALGFFLVAPSLSWSITLSDQPLFLEASIRHNLMFIVDDSGSMDWEILAPGLPSPESSRTSGYLFVVGDGASKTPYDSRPITSSFVAPFTERYWYLRSTEYNKSYYDPMATYDPWPDGATRSYSDVSPTSAPPEPNFPTTNRINLTANIQDSNGNWHYPATFFVKTKDGSVDKMGLGPHKCLDPSYPYKHPSRTRCYKSASLTGSYISSKRYDEVIDSMACDAPVSSWFSEWYGSPSSYTFTGKANALAPTGECIRRVEIKSTNAALIAEVTGGKTYAQQIQNFANWFSYYRRRHQAIRGAIAESLIGLERMNLGMFWLHNRRTVPMKDIETEMGSFLDDSYNRFGSAWTGGGTPLRYALAHAGAQYSRTSSPIVSLECQKNFTLMFTDGEANGHLTSFENADKDAPAPFGNPTYSSTQGDIAYYYNTRNIRPALPSGQVRVPSECGTPDEKAWMDCNKDPHMNTYTIGLGMVGEKFAGITHFEVMDAHKNPPNWGSIVYTDYNDRPAAIDDLYHAAVNGKGEYYEATSTEELRFALRKAIQDIQKTLGSASGVSFNTAVLEAGANLFSARFQSGTWSGTVQAKALSDDGKIGALQWDAAAVLDARDISASPRTILTYNGDGVPFQWGSLNAAQRADLEAGAPGKGEQRLAYLRGDRSLEALSDFRVRSSRLGDIVNSAPAYVGVPSMPWPDAAPFGAPGAPYSSFKLAQASRLPVVYVGANDGKLHAFAAKAEGAVSAGQEILAYIPSFVYSDAPKSGLHYLTEPFYEHKNYVDLTPAVYDVYIGGAWKSVLVGGLRGGGKGLFALDVTNPLSFSESGSAPADTVLWEFTHPNLGYLTEPPVVAMARWGAGDYRWSLIFSNGYGAGTSGLFVLDMAAGMDGSWGAGDFRFIPVGTSTEGLSPARLVDFMNESGYPVSDGIVDRAYAGDLFGNLWAIDLSTGSVSTWGSVYGSNPLFTAMDKGGLPQPITAQPIVSRNPYVSGVDPNLLVFVGTGRYLATGDQGSSQLQSFYGIHDKGAGGLTRANLVDRELYQQTITADAVTVPVRKTDDVSMDWSANSGWHVDFDLSAGERIVHGALVRGQYVVFNTIQPVSTACSAGGTSWLMAVRIDGSTGDDAVLDVTRNGVLDESDAGWAGTNFGSAMITGINTLASYLFGTTSDGGEFGIPFNAGAGILQRAGWREVMAE